MLALEVTRWYWDIDRLCVILTACVCVIKEGVECVAESCFSMCECVSCWLGEGCFSCLCVGECVPVCVCVCVSLCLYVHAASPAGLVGKGIRSR